VTHEFLDRQDGWAPLSARYGLQMRNVRGIDHALGYAGTATLAALIGVGGLREPIISGLNLNDYSTILQGAIPAALLALLRNPRIFYPRAVRNCHRGGLTDSQLCSRRTVDLNAYGKPLW
jgi:hypothetical protein